MRKWWRYGAIIGFCLYAVDGIPFPGISETSLFQGNLVRKQNFPDISLEEFDVSDTSKAFPLGFTPPLVWAFLASCEDSSGLQSNGSTWCNLSNQFSSLALHEEIQWMRSFAFPLAHAYRPHLGIEILAKVLGNFEETQAFSELANSTDSSSNSTLINSQRQLHSPTDLSCLEMEARRFSHKSIHHLKGLEISGIVMIAIACTIAVCVGVGGGGMFVPILILMLGFTTHESTGLAQALMVGGTLAGLLLNWHQRHPVADRPLIDVTMVLLLGPMQISGANVGVVINRMLPSWLIIAFTILVLGFTGYKTLIKGIEAYQKDRAANSSKAKASGLAQVHRNPPSTVRRLDRSKDTSLSLPAGISIHSPSRVSEDIAVVATISSPASYRSFSPPCSREASIREEFPEDSSPIAGLSDFVTSSAHKLPQPPPSSFSEAISTFGSFGNLSSPAAYIDLVSQHRQRHGHQCKVHPSSVSVGCMPRRRRSSTGRFSTDGPMRSIGDRILMALLPHQSSNSMIVMRSFHERRNDSFVSINNLPLSQASDEEKPAMSAAHFQPPNCLGGLNASQEHNEAFWLDESVGILYTEELMTRILSNVPQGAAPIFASPEIKPSGSKDVVKVSSVDPAMSTPALVSTAVPQRPRTRSAVLGNPMIRMISSTPILSAFVPSSVAAKYLSRSEIEALYSDAVARYVQACLHTDACILLHCCISPRSSELFSTPQIPMATKQWDEILINRKFVEFRVSRIEKKVNIIGAFRISRFEIEASSPQQLTLQLLEVRPVFDRNNTEEANEPRICAVLVSKVSNRDYLGCSELPAAMVDSSSERAESSQWPELVDVREDRTTQPEVDRVTSAVSSASTAIHGFDSSRAVTSGSDSLPAYKSSVHKQSSLVGTCLPEAPGRTSKQINAILRREKSRQYDKWAILLAIWGANCALILMKGGKTGGGIVSFCGAAYWTITAICVIFPGVASVIIGRYAVRLTNFRLALDVPFVEGELIYTQICVFHLLAQTFAAGIAAGVVGIGGGMILGPMMLSEGVSPQVTTAVNSTLVLFASSAAALNFIISGQADPVWSSFFFGVCFVSSLIGKYALDRIVKKLNLASLLVFLLLFIIIASLISMLVSGALDIIAFGFTGFSSPCA